MPDYLGVHNLRFLLTHRVPPDVLLIYVVTEGKYLFPNVTFDHQQPDWGLMRCFKAKHLAEVVAAFNIPSSPSLSPSLCASHSLSLPTSLCAESVLSGGVARECEAAALPLPVGGLGVYVRLTHALPCPWWDLCTD